jgi:hypothetical protein
MRGAEKRGIDMSDILTPSAGSTTSTRGRQCSAESKSSLAENPTPRTTTSRATSCSARRSSRALAPGKNTRVGHRRHSGSADWCRIPLTRDVRHPRSRKSANFVRVPRSHRQSRQTRICLRRSAIVSDPIGPTRCPNLQWARILLRLGPIISRHPIPRQARSKRVLIV